MAKAIVPMQSWNQREHVTRAAQIERRLRELFTKGIIGEADPTNGRSISTNSRGPG